ncbi:Hypothetical Protein FCC1311_050912 [Hondaea fermentalgiana]|uniref:Uncharacterized protein n=1 Tax=Hondaea fermentalgiana TaxID=2315210 RepID=A0A2R5GD17_9STRA|nr:Hypothetical Protein FCC1311_050912 [Hondaea fermentalgiana]|eukprot:GBG28870.1 Hypothetical Protein FCC1311_050912 [Hondaea fermentalgiana]
MAKVLGAAVALGVAAAYVTPLALWLGLQKDPSEVQSLMAPWSKDSLLGSVDSWGVLAGGMLLLYNLSYVLTLHAKMPTTQMRVTGLMRILVGIALLYAHFELKAPNMNLIIAGNDITTGLFTVLIPTSAMSLIPNTLITAVLGAAFFFPELRAKIGPIFAKLAAAIPVAKVDPIVPDQLTLFVLGSFLMAIYATLPLVGALTMNTRCLRATGKVAAYTVFLFAVAYARSLISPEVAVAYGGAHAIAAALLLTFVPKEAMPTKKQKTI